MSLDLMRGRGRGRGGERGGACTSQKRAIKVIFLTIKVRNHADKKQDERGETLLDGRIIQVTLYYALYYTPYYKVS
ncbi:hypothetical protein CRV24_000295 [Beauveria bassiana]|nr:hypothetical protein CRV24_000295 [Beauveria bassiana]